MAVSRAINNIGYVREETRERILEPANALNYRPTLAAKPLVTRRNRTIACAMANTSDPFHNLVGKGIEAVAFQKRCTTLMCDTHSAGRDRDCIDLLMSHRPGGAVFHRPNVKPERAAELAESGVHCVMMDNETKPEGVGAVGTDDALGSAMAAEDLFSRGHRRSAAFAACWSTHPAGRGRSPKRTPSDTASGRSGPGAL